MAHARSLNDHNNNDMKNVFHLFISLLNKQNKLKKNEHRVQSIKIDMKY